MARKVKRKLNDSGCTEVDATPMAEPVEPYPSETPKKVKVIQDENQRIRLRSKMAVVKIEEIEGAPPPPSSEQRKTMLGLDSENVEHA